MTRSSADARRWMDQGTDLVLGAVLRLDDDEFGADSQLPDWTRKHLVAHLAANADAIGNLVQWAATGLETPMYASADERAAGIAKGPVLSTGALRSWFADSSTELAAGMDALTDQQWQQEVRTAQGRLVPATETPWMRAREVMVHAVDLGLGIGFGDLPTEFNAALREDILAKRGLDALPAEVADAPEAEVTAWLAGRPHSITDAPALGPWL